MTVNLKTVVSEMALPIRTDGGECEGSYYLLITSERVMAISLLITFCVFIIPIAISRKQLLLATYIQL